MSGHHGEPVAGGFLHQDGHELPGRMGIEPVVHIADDPPHDGGVDCGKVPRKSLCDMFNCVAFGIGNHPHQPERPTLRPSIQQPVNQSARPVRLNHAPTPLSSPQRLENREKRPDSSHLSIPLILPLVDSPRKSVAAVTVAACVAAAQLHGESPEWGAVRTGVSGL